MRAPIGTTERVLIATDGVGPTVPFPEDFPPAAGLAAGRAIASTGAGVVGDPITTPGGRS
jgi:hypothetical protein